MKRTIGAALLLLNLGAGHVRAVDRGRVGIDLEVGARRLLGATYHLTDRVALRPGLFLQSQTAENTPSLIDTSQDLIVYETQETSFGGQLEVDYFLLRGARDLMPYVSATFAYAHVNSQYPVPQGPTLILRNGNLHNWSMGTGFGMQYAVADRIHVFGHVGLSYSSGQRFTVNGRILRSHSWSTATSALGAVFYFN
jgi:hypothetical protein